MKYKNYYFSIEDHGLSAVAMATLGNLVKHNRTGIVCLGKKMVVRFYHLKKLFQKLLIVFK